MQDKEWLKISDKFYELWVIVDCIEAIDGKNTEKQISCTKITDTYLVW